MALVKRNEGYLPSWPHWFDDFFDRDWFGHALPAFSASNTTIPSINIKETDDNYEVEVAAPGMSKDDFNITLDGNMLTISSEKTNRSEDKDGDKYSRREFSYESFQRSIQLPKDVVDEENIKAKYEDGVLRLTIPKREEAKQKAPRTIQIS